MTCENCKNSTASNCPNCLPSSLEENFTKELIGWRFFDESKRVGAHYQKEPNGDRAVYVRILMPENLAGTKKVMEKIKEFFETNFKEPL